MSTKKIYYIIATFILLDCVLYVFFVKNKITENLAISVEKYEELSQFKEGLARVKYYDKYGFINKSGKEVIPCIYDEAMDFADGRAAVRLFDNWNYVDKTGKEISLNGFERCSYFIDGRAVAYNRGAKLLDKDGRELTDYDRYYTNISIFSEGLASYEVKFKGNRKFGYLDKKGKDVIPYKYDYASPFKDGLALVSLEQKYGIIDKKGKEIIPPEYDNIVCLPNDFFIVKENGKNGVVNKKKKEIIPLVYDEIGEFSDELFCAKLDEKWGIIDKNNHEIIPFKYEYISKFAEGTAIAILDGKYGIINAKGEELISHKYDEVWMDVDFTDNFIGVKLNNKWGVINKERELVPCIYDDVNYISEEIVSVTKDGKEGLIDKNGRTLTAFKYDEIRPLQEGLFSVMIGYKWGIIDNNGKEKLPILFDDIISFSEDLFLVKYKNEYCYIDKYGNFASTKESTRKANIKDYIKQQFPKIVYKEINPLMETPDIYDKLQNCNLDKIGYNLYKSTINHIIDNNLYVITLMIQCNNDGVIVDVDLSYDKK